MSWEVTGAGSKENFLVIASRQRLEELERDIAAIPRADERCQVASAPLTAETLHHLKGIGGLTEADVPMVEEKGDRLSSIARALSGGAAGVYAIKTWQIQLDNPGR